MKWIKDILRGTAIGAANIIPGVSGGTMMVSMGIYGDVIGAVTGIFSHLKKSILILLPYVVGMALGIGGLSFVIGYMFEHFPVQTVMLFTGLIFGGLPMLLPKVRGKRISALETVIFITFFGIIAGIQFLGQGADRILVATPETAVRLFFVGTVAAATMVIPGVSGSMILMSFGYYTPIIDRINQFILALFTRQWSQLWNHIGVLVPFGMGVVIGIFLIAKLVEFLLKNYERKTYFAILGLVTASPVAILAGMSFENAGIFNLLAGGILFVVGVVTANLLGK